MDNTYIQLILDYYLQVLQKYWSIIDLTIVAIIVLQLRKLKRKSTHIETENISTATLVAKAEAQRVVAEAQRVAEEAKIVAEKTAEDLKHVANQVAKQLKKDNK